MTDAQDLPPGLDIVMRLLREARISDDLGFSAAASMLDEAATEIERLRAERDAVIEEAAKALEQKGNHDLAWTAERTVYGNAARIVRALKAEGSNPSSPSEASPTRRNPNDER